MSGRPYDLHDAAAMGDAAKVAALLADRVDPNQVGLLGNTPLHAVAIAYAFNATRAQNPALIATATALLEAGANPDAANGSGLSAAQHASAYAPVLGRLFHAYSRARALDAGLPSVSACHDARFLPSRRQRF